VLLPDAGAGAETVRRQIDPGKHHEGGRNLHDFTVPMLLPGIKINTSPTNFAPINQIQMARFDGERWKLFGPVLSEQNIG
jgi:hypothetical protein